MFKKIRILSLSILIFTGLLAGCSSMMGSMGMTPMGSFGDIGDSKNLWSTLKKQHLVGAGAKRSKVYMGTQPHGKLLETLHEKVTVNGHTGLAIIKRNYAGSGVSISNVTDNPDKYLKAVTVMFKREAGYDKENQDWFWAKYRPDGSLHTKNKMMMNISLAGRVAKGKPEGCISCHQSAPGGDYIFANDISAF